MKGARSTGAKKRADVLFSRIVRSRGRCEACGRTDSLQCAHIVSRRFNATRCMEDNAFCLCASCHLRFTEWPLEFAGFVIGRIGEDAYYALKRKAELGGKVDWEAVAAELSARWKGLAA